VITTRRRPARTSLSGAFAAPERSWRETGLRTPTKLRRRADVCAFRSHDERVISFLLRSSSVETRVGQFVSYRVHGVLRTVFAPNAQARLARSLLAAHARPVTHRRQRTHQTHQTHQTYPTHLQAVI